MTSMRSSGIAHFDVNPGRSIPQWIAELTQGPLALVRAYSLKRGERLDLKIRWHVSIMARFRTTICEEPGPDGCPDI